MKTNHILIWVVLFAIGMLFGGCSGQEVNLLPGAVSAEKLEKRTKKVLAETLAGGQPILRCHGLETLAQTKWLTGPSEVRKHLYDPSIAVRFAAAVAIGDMKDYPSRNLLTRMLHDDNPSVQLAAAYGLEKLGDDRFGKWYDNVLFGSDSQLTAQACMLLGKLGNTPRRQDSKKKLWKVLRKSEQTVTVRLQAAEALARLGDDKIIEKLMVYAGSGYADDRMLAISGLKAQGSQDAYAMLAVLLEDQQIEVRLAAMRALGAKRTDTIDLKHARKSLRYEAPQDDETGTMRVRSLAILALGAIGGDKEIGLLYQALGDKSEYIRISAARASVELLGRVKK